MVARADTKKKCQRLTEFIAQLLTLTIRYALYAFYFLTEWENVAMKNFI